MGGGETLPSPSVRRLPCTNETLRPLTGEVPFWAFLERVERLLLSDVADSTPSSRDRGLSSVRSIMGIVAPLANVSTPLGRARAWIRHCLVSKSLEASISTVLEEDPLVEVIFFLEKRVARKSGAKIVLVSTGAGSVPLSACSWTERFRLRRISRMFLRRVFSLLFFLRPASQSVPHFRDRTKVVNATLSLLQGKQRHEKKVSCVKKILSP